MRKRLILNYYSSWKHEPREVRLMTKFLVGKLSKDISLGNRCPLRLNFSNSAGEVIA